MIPSRGALFLAQSDVLDTTARERIGAQGSEALAPEQNGALWTDRSQIRITAVAPATSGYANTGKLLRGTNEFAGLRGSFTESWDLEEVNADGSTRGRILLSTLSATGN